MPDEASTETSTAITFSLKVPPFVRRLLSFAYVRQVITEIIQTALIAGAAAGLTSLAQMQPDISEHYGLSPLVTAQLIAVIGSARAAVSGLNSTKNGASQ